MLSLFQKTIKEKVIFKGHGLHSGLKSVLKIIPAEENFGIVFKRIDLEKNNLIPANYKNVSSAQLCTTLQNDSKVTVSTVEHLLAALYITGIDNALIEIDNEEVPILDGSAKLYVEKIILSGFKTSEVPIKIIKILKKIEFKDKDRFIYIEPTTLNLNINFELRYNNKIIGNQKNTVKVYEDNLEDIFNSRTFCLFEDIEMIKKHGLAKGGSLENAIVVKNEKILNEEGLRNDKEFVNHKILDCIGDLFTSGYRIIGNVVCSQGGHYMTNQLLRKVFKNKENFSIIEIKQKNLPHTLINKSLLKSIA